MYEHSTKYEQWTGLQGEDCASVLEVDRVQEIVRRRASMYNVQVVWSNNDTTASTVNNKEGGYTITIPAIKLPCSREDLVRTYMYVVHECGHLVRPKVWDIAIAAKPNAILMAIFNIVEDDSMERFLANSHLGDAKTLGEGNAILALDAKAMFEQSLADPKCPPITEEALLPMIVMSLQLLSRREWDGWSRKAVDECLAVMPKEGQPLLTTLVKEGWVDKFRATVDEYDSWNLACDLYRRLYPEDKSIDEVQQAGNSGIPREAEAKDEKQEQPACEGTAEEKKEEQEGYVINWQDVVMSEHDHEGVPSNGGPAGITWEGYKAGNHKVAFMPDDKVDVFDLTDPNTILPTERDVNRRSKRFLPAKDSAASALANRIRRYIQAQSRVKFNSEQEHGKINNKELVRLVMPPVDNGNWNRKVFYNYTDKQAVDTAVLILVDWSGSMSGAKMKYASAAAIRATHIFSRILRVPVCVSAFTTARSMLSRNSNEVAIIKPFNKPQSPEAMAISFSRFATQARGNNDADALMWGYRQLMKRKEKRKILIVMSDGAPSACYSGVPHLALLVAARQIQDKSPVEICGIGIKSTAVKQYYDNYKVVNELGDINDALFEVLKRSVSRD